MQSEFLELYVMELKLVHGFSELVLTHYQTTNFRLFQTERVSDDNFRFDENGRKLSKQVENTEGKGEIARYEQFLLFPQCFQKACFPGASKGVIVWEWVKTEFCMCTFKVQNIMDWISNPMLWVLIRITSLR